MKRLILITFISSFFCVALFAQKIGEWNSLFSYEKDITALAQSDEQVYAVSDGKLFSYNPSDESVETFAKIGEDSITHITYIKSQECLLIIRSNSDIDLLYSGGKYINISDVKNISLNLDKKINDVFVEENFAYLSTNFGLVILDLAKKEIKESAMFRYPFYSSAIYNEKIYAVTSNGTIRIAKNQAIQYLDNWEKINLSSTYSGNEPFSDDEIQRLSAFDSRLTFFIPSKAVYMYDGNKSESVSSITNPQDMLVANGRLFVFNNNRFWDLSNFSDIKSVSIPGDDLLYLAPYNTKSNEYWVALKGQQLSVIKTDMDNNVEMVKTSVRPNGPSSNFAYYMIFEHNKLLTVGGMATNKGFGYPAELSEYKNNLWFNFDLKEIGNMLPDVDLRDFVNVAVDPNDPEHIFVSCFGGTGSNAGRRNGGIYEFQDRKFKQLYNHENTPVIEEAAKNKGVILMNGMSFDKAGNLWMQNPLNTKNSIVVRKKDGTWTSLYYKDISENTTNPKTLLVDKYNNKWSATYAGDFYYIFIFNEGSVAIDNTAGHNTRYLERTQFYDQDGNYLNFGELLCLKEDLNGNIWVGTNIGIFLIYNSSNIFNTSKKIVFNKIKVPKNDGSNEANILLENVPVQTIAVDGANRKWIGTKFGLYVINSTGLETHHYFTKENSILPSNNILSLAIDPETGLVYIGTEKGIVTYKGEATEGKQNFSDVYAYPNPVRPDYDGPIAITGLKEKSTVKITDVKGNLIHQGISLGGQYIWDGRNTKRERVDTGVYLVFGSSEDGKDGVVTKIMVVSNN